MNREINSSTFKEAQVVPRIQLHLETDYQLLAQEIIKTIRKDVPQRDLSLKLGYSFNQVGKWESGATQIKMEDFLLLAKHLDIDIEKHFHTTYGYYDSVFNSAGIIHALDVINNLNSITDSNFLRTLNKWRNGVSVPDFSEVLKLMGRNSPTMLMWLALFLDCEKIGLLNESHQALLRNIDVMLADVNVGYINAALQLTVYKNLETHDEILLAKHSACTVEELRAGLDLLLKQGMITLENGKYQPCPFDFSFPGLRNPKLRNLTKRTLDLLHERYPDSNFVYPEGKSYGPTMGAVRVNAVSAEASKKIAEMIMNFHSAVGEVVKQDSKNPKDHVQLISLMSMPSDIYR